MKHWLHDDTFSSFDRTMASDKHRQILGDSIYHVLHVCIVYASRSWNANVFAQSNSTWDTLNNGCNYQSWVNNNNGGWYCRTSQVLSPTFNSQLTRHNESTQQLCPMKLLNNASVQPAPAAARVLKYGDEVSEQAISSETSLSRQSPALVLAQPNTQQPTENRQNTKLHRQKNWTVPNIIIVSYSDQTVGQICLSKAHQILNYWNSVEVMADYRHLYFQASSQDSPF